MMSAAHARESETTILARIFGDKPGQLPPEMAHYILDLDFNEGDKARIHDPLPFAKQVCLAHLPKTCGEIERSKTRAAVRFSRRVAALLRKAMALMRRRGTIGDHGYAVLRGKIHAELDRLLAGTSTDPDNARLAKRLRKQREHLLRFLDHDGVDATNNLAEREIRPAVIARKLSAGDRTEAGAETHAVLASVLPTCRRQGMDIIQSPGDMLRQGRGHLVPFAHLAPAKPVLGPSASP